MGITEAIELLGRIRDQAENLLAAATLRVDASIHVEGLTGGLREIVAMIDDAGVARED